MKGSETENDNGREEPEERQEKKARGQGTTEQAN